MQTNSPAFENSTGKMVADLVKEHGPTVAAYHRFKVLIMARVAIRTPSQAATEDDIHRSWRYWLNELDQWKGYVDSLNRILNPPAMGKPDEWFEDALKKKKGGAQPGAGRPPAGTVRMEVRVKPATKAEIERRAKSEGKTPGKIIDELLT